MFIFKTALKYMFSKNHGQRTNSLLSIFGIALSILAVLVVSSIMNGLQNSQIERLRNLESFDYIVYDTEISPETLKESVNVQDCFEFLETTVLLKNPENGVALTTRLRAFDYEVIKQTKMNNEIFIYGNEDSFNSGLILSYINENALSVVGDKNLEVTFLKKGKTATLSPKNANLIVKSEFSSKLTDYNDSTTLISLNLAKKILNPDKHNLGIYSNSKEKDLIKDIKSIDQNAKIVSWQEYNKVIYSALTLEKAMVYLFLVFMFLILCINLKNSTSRLINIKRNENAILMAIGSAKMNIVLIYMVQGILITLAGETAGVLLSFLFLKNIQSIFNIADKIAFLFTGTSANLSAFSFFISINYSEILIVILFVLLLAVLFIYLGCRKLFKQSIMEAILNVSY